MHPRLKRFPPRSSIVNGGSQFGLGVTSGFEPAVGARGLVVRGGCGRRGAEAMESIGASRCSTLVVAEASAVTAAFGASTAAGASDDGAGAGADAGALGSC